MSTPTFPERLRSRPVIDDEPFEAELLHEAEVPVDRPQGTGDLAAFASGVVRPADVSRLSDLDREAAARFAAEWPNLPDVTRERIVRAMDDLTEDHVELNFGRTLRIALDDPSPVVRQLAVAALWEDEQPDLLDEFRGIARRDPSPDVRAEAARGLGKFAHLAASGDLTGPPAAALRDDLFTLASDEREPEIVRQRALESVAAFGGDSEIQGLIDDAYATDDQAWQGTALFAMGQSVDRRWLPTVIDELASPDAHLRFEAARACGVLGEDAAVPELLECAKDDDTEVRHAAIAALGQIGGRNAIRALQSLATTADEADQSGIEGALEEAIAIGDDLGLGG